MKNTSRKTDPCILIEGPRWGDAEFYGKWLLAAAKAETLWKEAYADPEFEKRVDRLTATYIPDFGIAAALIAMDLRKTFNTVVVPLSSELADDFVMMFGMGFFQLTGDRYQMTIPAEPTLARVKSALLKYAETEDENYDLHPELLVKTLQLREAIAVRRA